MNLLFTKRILSRPRLFLLFLFLVAVPLTAWQLYSAERVQISDSFLVSRRESAVIATQIVDLSRDSVSTLDKIRELEKNRKYFEALDLINSERGKVSAMRPKGSELLGELTSMANALSDIQPIGSREAALQAINYETEIINQLISYNNNLDQVLLLLTSRLLYGEDISAKLEARIKEINEQAKRIEEFNAKFNAAMEVAESGGKSK